MPAPPEAIAVLLVEDDDEDYLLTKDMLSGLAGSRYTVRRAHDRASALAASREDRYDVCLVDYRLGADDGIELVRELVECHDEMPVIVLTGKGGPEVDMQAEQAGAADYLVKGEIGSSLLERSIRYAISSQAAMQAVRTSEEGLRRAQRMEAIGQLAGGVAHDFNNMMSAVIGFADVALNQIDPTDERLRRYLIEIRRAGVHAAALTQQLLAFSRKQVLQTRVFDLNVVLADVEMLLRRLLPATVEIVTRIDPNLDLVSADPVQMEQVIVNLAINAGDAMPNGGQLTLVTDNVTVDEHPGLAAGAYVILRVADTGVGIDAETLERIYEPFFTTKDVGEGTGLGLSTVFGIVKQSGGDIQVSSEPGRGTSFDVYLPRARAADQAVPEPRDDSTPQRGSETILLVDDEKLVLEFAAEVLTDCGYKVLAASDPRHALELAAEHSAPIHLLVTDVVMPGMSGPELAVELTRDRPETAVLFMSGYDASGALLERGILDSGAPFLPKPMSLAELARTVRDVLDASPVGRAGG